MMNIVVLDDMEATVSQHQSLESLGKLKVFHGIPKSENEIIRRANSADVLILGWTHISRDVLVKLPRLKFIAVWATGYDYIDVNAATDMGILIANVPNYATNAVAEMTIALMLSLSRKIVPAHAHVQKGEFNWKGFKGSELFKKTIGIIGTGHIGSKVAKLTRGFGMEVIATTRNPSMERSMSLEVKYVSLDILYRESDFVSLHLPLNPDTKGMINKKELEAMKSSAYLINTARAGLVDQKALYDALKNEQIAGAGLDDLSIPDERIIGLRNVVITPHIAFYTNEAIVRKTDICIENVAGFLAGKPQNIVNPGISK